MDTTNESARTTLCDEGRIKDLSDIETEDTPSFVRYHTQPRLVRLAFILLFAITVLIPLVYLLVAHAQNYEYDQCGTNADEARARGCVFEITGFTWLPKRCHDPKTEEEFVQFIATNELGIYRDANYTEQVPIDEVRLGNGPGFFVRQQYHVSHCLFLIKKLHRAFASGQTLDGQIMPTHHTEHCVHMALKPPGFRKNAVQLSYTKYPYCGKPGGYNVAWGYGKPLEWTDY